MFDIHICVLLSRLLPRSPSYHPRPSLVQLPLRTAVSAQPFPPTVLVFHRQFLAFLFFFIAHLIAPLSLVPTSLPSAAGLQSVTSMCFRSFAPLYCISMDRYEQVQNRHFCNIDYRGFGAWSPGCDVESIVSVRHKLLTSIYIMILTRICFYGRPFFMYK